MKKHILKNIKRMGFDKVRDFIISPKGLIVMLHRVVPNPTSGGFSPNARWEVTPQQIEAFIREAWSLDFEFVDIDEAHRRLISNDLFPDTKRFVCLTFDDGYTDTYKVAHECCQSMGVPITVYVTSGLIDRSSLAWWELLERVIRDEKTLNFKNSAGEWDFHIDTDDRKLNAFSLLSSRIKESPTLQRNEFIENLIQAGTKDALEDTKALFLTADELNEFANSPGTVIGAHTRTHAKMRGLTEIELLEEVYIGTKNLAQIIQRPVEHFAYPFGTEKDAGPREYRAVKNAGFKTAVTTCHGVVQDRNRQQLCQLPRVGLFPTDDKIMHQLKLTGTTTIMRRIKAAA